MRFPSITNFKSAHTLALDEDFAVQRAQFDLTNVAANIQGSQACFYDSSIYDSIMETAPR
jgi:hypothetical protein